MFLFVFQIGSITSWAVEAPFNRLQSQHAQDKTLKALQAIEQERWSLARDMIASTKDPLASKLYYWLLFSRGEGEPHFVRLAQFIRHNSHWPGIRGLRLLAEETMPGNLSTSDISAWFDDYPPLTAPGMDRYVEALVFQGKIPKAKKILAEWWAEKLLSREDQRGIYKKYSNFIDLEAHTRRFDTLLFARQYTNARAIAKVLGQGYPALAEARIALAEDKNGVNALIDKVPRNLQNDPGLLYERARWRRRHDLDLRAMEILHNPPPASKIQNPGSWWHERHILVRRLIEKKHYESAYLLASKHVQEKGLPYAQAEWLSGWLALRFLDNAPRALEHFEALYHKVSTPVSKARAAYWAGRAAKALGMGATSKTWFKNAARFQTVFYGQLAGAQLGGDVTFPNAAPPNLTSSDKSLFNASDLVQAARLFHGAGMRDEASRFVHSFVSKEKSPKAYRFGAELAADLGHYHDAIRIAKDATKAGMFLTAQSYPVITSRLKNIDLEWALVHALIRQESMFDYKAQSPAGARGLMQLMPATARQVAKKIGIQHEPSWLTLNPDHNIRLGSRYLQDMLKRFDNSYPLAVAAYNAGPGRVRSWIKDFGDPRIGEVDLIDWIELIPIYETRNYVQRVMEGLYVYRLRLKDVQKRPVDPIHIVMSGNP